MMVILTCIAPPATAVVFDEAVNFFYRTQFFFVNQRSAYDRVFPQSKALVPRLDAYQHSSVSDWLVLSLLRLVLGLVV